MLRRHAVLAVAGLVLPTLVSAGELELPAVELGWAARVAAPSGAPAPTPAVAAATPVARLVWLDPTGTAFGTETVARPEVARLLHEMGVAASWRRGDPHEVARPEELRVIFLDRTTQREPDAPVLGATPASFQAERFVWVHVPSVRASAGIQSARGGPALDLYTSHRLGIALARVIAHEVVHALAPSLPHGSGLMSARLSQAMLTGANLHVDPGVGLAVRAALLGAVPATRAGGEILAARSTRKEEVYR